MNVSLEDYLRRIDYAGPVEVSREALFGVHRAHIDSVAYENLAIQLGGVNTLAESDILAKIVTRRRGGWCYEMNGSFTWALRQMGFAVTRVSGAVRRDILGDVSCDNHLVGTVDLNRRYVVDVGLSDGPREGFRAIRDTTLIESDGNEKSETEVDSLEQYREVLTDLVRQPLGDEPDILWPKVSERAALRAEEGGHQRATTHTLRYTTGSRWS